MDYSSSYAVGGSSPDGGTGALSLPATSGPVVLPTPAPQRMHWSTLLLVAGISVCFVALLATIAGVPGKMGYDPDAAPVRSKPDTSDPLGLVRNLDGNMKWVDQSTSDSKGAYVGYIKSINRNEAAIPAMAQAMMSMDTSLKSMDSGLGEVAAITSALSIDLEKMSAATKSSAATMRTLNGDIGFLSQQMLTLSNATSQLTTRMADLERRTGAIARNGTAQALISTKEMNAVLPDKVPSNSTTDGRQISGGGGSHGMGLAQ